MVCPRCKMSVRHTLLKAGYKVVSVELGEAIINEELTDKQLLKLEAKLKALGFELIKDRKSELIERIKNLIVELVHYSDNKPEPIINYSEYISKKLNREYHYLSTLFSEAEGISIQKYFILQRIERAKELIAYDEQTLQAIAYRLHYRSIHYFSNQFKSVTGMSPTAFKLLKEKKRKNIDEIGKKLENPKR